MKCIKHLSPNIVSLLGGTTNKDKYYTIPCIVTSTPNRDGAHSGMCRMDVVNGLGSHNYGCTVLVDNSIDGTQFNYLITWDNVLKGRSNGLQVWSDITKLRDPIKVFTNARKNESNLLQLLHYLYEECYGDKVQSLLLLSRYYLALNKFKQQQLKQTSDKVERSQPVLLIGEQFTNFMVKIDTIFKSEMYKCYSTFHCITESIVSKQQLHGLIVEYKRCLPDHYRLIKSLFC